METVKKYLYNFFTKADLLVPNIPSNQINSAMLKAYISNLESGKEIPTVLVFEQNKIKFIAGGTHAYLACLILDIPPKMVYVDNLHIEPARLPYLFYQEWYRTLVNLRSNSKA